MTLLEQLKADLMLMETSDRALSRLLSAKRDLLAWKNPPASVRPEYDACLKLLEDLPSRVECLRGIGKSAMNAAAEEGL